MCPNSSSAIVSASKQPFGGLAYDWHHLSVPQSNRWPCSRSHIVNPLGALRVKQAIPFGPHVAPTP